MFLKVKSLKNLFFKMVEKSISEKIMKRQQNSFVAGGHDLIHVYEPLVALLL